MNNTSLRPAIPLFLLLFIDAMGMGILFPILAVAFMNPSSHFLSIHTSHGMRTFYYGLVISTFMLCWFVGATVLGDYSDIKGRKYCLNICLSGAAVGYTLSGFALMAHSLALLIIGRVIAGLTAGSQSIAQAAIVDLSAKDNLNRNMGYIVLSICLGFVAGPLIGGLFSDNQLMRWLTLQTPMFIAAILSIINLLLLQHYFKETHTLGEPKKFQPMLAFRLFADAFKQKRLRLLCVVFFIFVCGWSNYYNFISLYLVRVFHYTIVKTALFSACMGLGFSIGSGIINARISHVSSKHLALGAIAASLLCCALSSFTQREALLWLYAFIIGISMSIGFTNLTTLFSKQVNVHEQGWVMGINGSVMALSSGVSTLAGATLGNWQAQLPLWVASGALLISAFILIPGRLKT